MKHSKKLLSLLLCAIMVLGTVAIGGDGVAEMLDAFSVKASALANHTQAEAVEWARARGNEHWEINDGSGWTQCVELIWAYYDYLLGYHVRGNACDYLNDNYGACPYSSDWTRPAKNQVQPGDICIWDGNPGHIGIVLEVNGNSMVTVESNAGYARGAADIYYNRTVSSLDGIIRPSFISHAHDYTASVSISKAPTSTSSGTRRYFCSCGAYNDDTIPAMNYTTSFADGTVCKIVSHLDNNVISTNPDQSYVSFLTTNSTQYTDQEWTLYLNSDGTYTIQNNYYSSRVLDIRDSSMFNGGTVQTCPKNGSNAQKFYIVPANGYYKLVAKNSYMCVDAGQGNGRIHQWADIAASNSAVVKQLWEIRPLTYTINYNANGGSGAPESQTKTSGVNIKLSSTKPTRTECYTFKEWNTKSDGTGTGYAAGASFAGNGNVTLYAQWTQSHSYIETKIPATCTEDAYLSCVCEKCGAKTTKALSADVVYSAWTDKKPDASSEYTIETKNQYRYRTTTQTAGDWVKKSDGTHYYFNRPSGFKSSEYSNYNTAALTAYENATTKRVINSTSHNSYIYWHWAYPVTYGTGTNVFIGSNENDYNASYGQCSTVWEAFESTDNVTTGTSGDCHQVWSHSNYSYWWFRTETFKQTYTDYTRATVTSWSAWSGWQDKSVTASDTTQVEKRVMYRTKTSSGDVAALGHNYVNGICTRCGASEEGYSLNKVKESAKAELDLLKNDVASDEAKTILENAKKQIDAASSEDEILTIKTSAIKSAIEADLKSGNNVFDKSVIQVASEKNFDYRSIVTIKATATGVPEGYKLAIYLGSQKVAEGDNKSVSYEYGELKSDLNYSVKVIDANGAVQKDSSGTELRKDGGKITCNAGFFKKLIAFFKGLFKSLPKVEVKP